MSIRCGWFLPQMTPLDVALKRGHEKTEEFLRGAGMSHVSTHTAGSRLDVWQSKIETEQYSVMYFDHITVFEVL